MRGRRVALFVSLAAGVLLVAAVSAPAQAPVTLVGAVQFGDDHPLTRTMRKFEELVTKHYGKPVAFTLRRNGELGLEKDYFVFMSQGLSVDYAVVAASHMATYSKLAPLMDMPFLFRDLDHWTRALDGEALQPIAADVLAKADVMLIGYAGGGTRNIAATKPVRTMAELDGLRVRVIRAPIQTRMFQAITTAPTIIADGDVASAMRTGVIQGAESEAAAMEQTKLYEVGPEVSLTQHAIAVRPLCFSGKVFRRLPADLQRAIVKAGKEAAAYGRQVESSEDAARLARLEKDGKLHTHRFTERAKLFVLAEPVKQAYAKEIGADTVLARVNAVK